MNNYFDADLSRLFDALVWFEETSSVSPLAGAPADGAPDCESAPNLDPSLGRL